jgi:hypothetical protein
MKKVTVKMFFALAAVALAAPFFAFAVYVGARAVEMATDTRQSLLLLALAVVAALSGAINSRGAREPKEARVTSVNGIRARKSSLLHHGL